MKALWKWASTRDVLLILAGVILMLLAVLVGVYWNPAQGTKAAPVHETLVILLGSIGGLVATIGVSGPLSTKSLIDAVTATAGAKPEFMRDYVKPEVVMDLLQSSLVARTQDRQFSRAVARDLLGAFIENEAVRVRTAQTYSIVLTHASVETPDAGQPKQVLWTCREELIFDERLSPSGDGADPVVENTVAAALVFCEAALKKWFDPQQKCLYRTVAWLPRHLLESAQSREAWARQNLDCKMWLGGTRLRLEPEYHLDGPLEEWAVEFVLKTTEDEVGVILDAARDGREGDTAQVRVRMSARVTLSPTRRTYTAYLAYPTLDPEIEFRIDGPVENLECATFYNLGSWAEQVDCLDPGRTTPRHITVRLCGERWVFPTSGAVFTWTMDDDVPESTVIQASAGHGSSPSEPRHDLLS